MARQVITTTNLVDDIDGGVAERTVTFGYDGHFYEIELSKKHIRELEKALQPYLGAARKLKMPRTAKPARTSANGRRPDLRAIREWAQSQGMGVSDRGRIPQHVIEAYDATQVA